jgi:replication-associated recombination protein RarA
VANLTPAPQRVVVTGLDDGPVSRRTLDVASADQAMADPEAFRVAREAAAVTEGRLTLDLAPYAVARLDGAT